MLAVSRLYVGGGLKHVVSLFADQRWPAGHKANRLITVRPVRLTFAFSAFSLSRASHFEYTRLFHAA